jgi:hypothetical protein
VDDDDMMDLSVPCFGSNLPSLKNNRYTNNATTVMLRNHAAYLRNPRARAHHQPSPVRHATPPNVSHQSERDDFAAFLLEIELHEHSYHQRADATLEYELVEDRRHLFAVVSEPSARISAQKTFLSLSLSLTERTHARSHLRFAVTNPNTIAR